MGLESQTGSLVVGKKADIVLLRKNDLNLFPVTDPVQTIVVHAKPVQCGYGVRQRRDEKAAWQGCWRMPAAWLPSARTWQKPASPARAGHRDGAIPSAEACVQAGATTS